MCEIPETEGKLVTVDEAVLLLHKIIAGKPVDHDKVLDIKAYCYVDPNFSSELFGKLHWSEHFAMTILNHATYKKE